MADVLSTDLSEATDERSTADGRDSLISRSVIGAAVGGGVP